MFVHRIVQALRTWFQEAWEILTEFWEEAFADEGPPASELLSRCKRLPPIDPQHAKVFDFPPQTPHDAHVTILWNMQNAIIRPGEAYTISETYIDVDPRLSDRRTTWKLVRRKWRAKIALERGPTRYDELVMALGIAFAAPEKRAERINGIRIQLYDYVERYGLSYGRWFLLRDIVKDIRLTRWIRTLVRLLKAIRGS